MVDRDPFEEIDRINTEEPPAGAANPPDLLHADIVRLAKLTPLGCQTERKPVAVRHRIGLAALDKAVEAERARHRAETAARLRRKPPPGPGEVRWPPGFTMKADGLYGPPRENTPPAWIAVPFEVLGHTRDHAGESWGTWLRWDDRDGLSHTFALPAEWTVADPGRLEAELMSRGLRISTDPGARMLPRKALAEKQPGDRVRIAYATGWQGNDDAPAFLLPDGTVLGTPAERVVLHAPAADAAQRCSVAGTLEGWKSEVAARAVGNPLATFCVSGAFTGPMLHPAGETGGEFLFCGRSKVGKTLAVQISGIPSFSTRGTAIGTSVRQMEVHPLLPRMQKPQGSGGGQV